MGDVVDMGSTLVLTTSAVPLEAHTMQALQGAIAAEWRRAGVGRPHRFQYTRGEALLIERYTARADLGGLSGLATPYQVIRSQSEISLLSEGAGSLISMCLASEQLHRRGAPTRSIVCRDRAALDRWIGQDLDIGRVLNVRVLEDPDVPPQLRCFVCGSAMSDMLSDIEYSVGIQREERA